MYNSFTVGGWIKYVASRATDGLTNGDMFTSYQLCKGKNTLSSNSLDASSVCRYTCRSRYHLIRCHVPPADWRGIHYNFGVSGLSFENPTTLSGLPRDPLGCVFVSSPK